MSSTKDQGSYLAESAKEQRENSKKAHLVQLSGQQLKVLNKDKRVCSLDMIGQSVKRENQGYGRGETD